MCSCEEISIRAAENNIRNALADYQSHVTFKNDAVENASEEFITRLARDSYYAKNDLRKLFSKSPAWHPELDAIIINGTRTHEPDPCVIQNLVWKLLASKYWEFHCAYRFAKADAVRDVVYYFTKTDNLDPAVEVEYEKELNLLVPGCYHKGKKKSRILKALCVGLGIADETANSEFQRIFAKVADEMNSKKIDFKLFVSINPAHFLTMSNPKNDSRGETLTSCHSLNNGEYTYKNGCTGYARDTTSFIVFTVDNPNNPELLNNRKTSRQIFAYRPGSGLLLQSRMYNTSGGTYGAVSETKVYRDLIQREISDLEDMPNLWKTVTSYDHQEYIRVGEGFGGYTDWSYSDFDGHICFRNDCDKDNVAPLTIGTYGLCFYCGDECSEGLLCDACDESIRCQECGNLCDEDDLTIVHDTYGNEISVCEDCCDRYYEFCNDCEEWYPNDEIICVDGGYTHVCEGCLEEDYTRCDCCGEYYLNEDTFRAFHDGEDETVCESCLQEHYLYCDYCEEAIHEDNINTIYDKEGKELFICDDCLTIRINSINNGEDIQCCPECGAYYEGELTVCPNCGVIIEKEEVSA